jgi:hypothetical protein
MNPANTSPEQTVWADRFGNGRGNGQSDGHDTAASESTASESATELRGDIRRTRARLSGTIDAIQQQLTPQHFLRQATDSVASSANQLATQAQALGNDAQARATDLALAARDQAGQQVQQLRTWYDRMRLQYPWLPAALIGGACGVVALAALLIWLGARSDG